MYGDCTGSKVVARHERGLPPVISPLPTPNPLLHCAHLVTPRDIPFFDLYRTQNPVGLKPRGGSIPPSGTKLREAEFGPVRPIVTGLCAPGLVVVYAALGDRFSSSGGTCHCSCG